jgi:thiamine pyrophosphate-dependent acetolactate synthase large subunit-like protein
MPILALGATGPVAADKRGPGSIGFTPPRIRAALLRHFTKWDDEPRSPEAIVEGMLKAYQMATTPRTAGLCVPRRGLRSRSSIAPSPFPIPCRFRAPVRAVGLGSAGCALADMIAAAKYPLFLFGRVRGIRTPWNRRVAMVEHTGAAVLTSIRERSVFPTDHPQQCGAAVVLAEPKGQGGGQGSDLIVSFDWVDLNGFFLQMSRKTADTAAKIAHVSLDAVLHNGWSMDHFSLPPRRPAVTADPDVLIAQLLPVLQKRLISARRPQSGKSTMAPADYSANSAREIMPRDVEVALERARGQRKFSLAHTTIGWAGDVYAFRDPLDFLGHDGGAGLRAWAWTSRSACRLR